jgi:hypothetical protein
MGRINCDYVITAELHLSVLRVFNNALYSALKNSAFSLHSMIRGDYCTVNTHFSYSSGFSDLVFRFVCDGWQSRVICLHQVLHEAR